jgi:hypothetical protein
VRFLSQSKTIRIALLAIGLPLLAIPIHGALAGSANLFQMGGGGVHPPLPQVEVLRCSDAVIHTASSSTISVESRFQVSGPIPENYNLMLSVVDSHGNVVGKASNDLNNVHTILPTSRWLGPITLMTSMTLPKLADGRYSLLLTLSGKEGTLQLTPGVGVVEDALKRYEVGSISIEASAPVPSGLPAASLDLTGYHLTLDESFTKLNLSDSDRYDGSRWYTRNEQCCMSTTDGSGTAMVGLSSPQNPYSVLPGGGLNIRLQKRSNAWTSGVITSVDSLGRGFSQQYGYFEMKAKFPPGEDTWPAFWLLNTASKMRHAPSGEIDIVEYVANPGFPRMIATTLHDWSNNTAPAASHYLVPLPSSGFHTYGMLWTANTMTFYIDGAATLSTPTPAIMKQPYYLLADLGIGSGWPTEKTPSTNDMQIQYIRAYAKN